MISSTSWVLGAARKPVAPSSFAQGPFPEASFTLPVPFTLNRQTCPLHHGWRGSGIWAPSTAVFLTSWLPHGGPYSCLSSSEQEEASSPPLKPHRIIPALPLYLFSFTNPSSQPASVLSSWNPLIPLYLLQLVPSLLPSLFLFSCFLTSSPCHLTFHRTVLWCQFSERSPKPLKWSGFSSPQSDFLRHLTFLSMSWHSLVLDSHVTLSPDSSPLPLIMCSKIIFFFFFARPHILLNISPSTRGRTCITTVKAWNSNHQATRELPKIIFLLFTSLVPLMLMYPSLCTEYSFLFSHCVLFFSFCLF